MMDVAVVGTGYVGLVAGTCLAEVGHRVVCVDNDERKVRTLREGKLPIYEPGIVELVPRNAEAGRLSFTSDLRAAAADARVVFIAVGTPQAADGAADLSAVLRVAGEIAETLTGDELKVVVMKSTVPVGTNDRVRALIAERTSTPFAVVSNPEFLREGVALSDFMEPDRIVLGSISDEAIAVMRELYAPIARREGTAVVVMDPRSAELTKYASNAMLATRISFMNDIANLCDQAGADVEQVRAGMGSDHRIGRHFLRAGTGYGGSCFPKDVQALLKTGKDLGSPLELLEAVVSVNARQKSRLVQMLREDLGDDLAGRRIALWGLAFKPETDDMREAPSITIARALTAAGARVVGYDPEAMQNARAELGELLDTADDPYAAAEGADALLLVTEWPAFERPDWARLAGLMASPSVYDGRNYWDPDEVRAAGFRYRCIGRP